MEHAEERSRGWYLLEISVTKINTEIEETNRIRGRAEEGIKVGGKIKQLGPPAGSTENL